MLIRKASETDIDAVYQLHKAVARMGGGIARQEAEITPAYIETIFEQTARRGLMLVGVDEPVGGLIAEMHASTYGLTLFDHILTHLTIVVRPDRQGKGIGKALFTAFLAEVDTHWPGILRIELEARESNKQAISLYESLGFVQEGIMKRKNLNPDGTFDDSLLFARLTAIGC